MSALGARRAKLIRSAAIAAEYCKRYCSPMSEEKLATVRRAYEHFIATGEPLEATFHRDFVLDMSSFRGWPERRHYEGIEGLREFVGDWFGTWEEGGDFDVMELREADEKVLALIHLRGHAKGSGVPVEMEISHLITFKDGKQFRMTPYASHAEGFAAAGIEDEKG
jgi:ketosteroid isomerase-like protein